MGRGVAVIRTACWHCGGKFVRQVTSDFPCDECQDLGVYEMEQARVAA